MKLHLPAALAAFSLLFVSAAFAGRPIPKLGPSQDADKNPVAVLPDGKDAKELAAPWRAWLPAMPAGKITLGVLESEDGAGIYLDSITGLWAPASQDKFLFLDNRLHWEEGDQFISSTGLGYRQMIPGREIIIGGNVFWNAVHSQNGNDLNQLGLGVEVLTKWVDFRFNYYLPEDDRFEIGRSSSKHSHTRFGDGGFTRVTRHNHFQEFESGLEGFNTEVGFLIPGLEKFAEVRAFAGYYHFENPFGGDFNGFKGRLEARLLRGVTANVEYWDDAQLMGGHWTGEIAVSLPFSIYNLFTGKNPFEGAADSFRPLPRSFQDRMGDMIERSHRIQTTTSGEILTDRSTSRKFTPFGGGGTRGSSGGGGGGSGFPIE
jgi:hypothetical protein